MFEYFTDQIVNIGIIFLQETHSSEDTFNEWQYNFKGWVFFLHGTTRSCGVMIGYLGKKSFQLIKSVKVKLVEV